jgi:PPM family protein phosphatase
LALVVEDGEERLAIINIGDSRVYLLRQGELEQLTSDHSLVQELIDDGQLSEADATVHPQRHVLTRALGVDAEVPVDSIEVLPVKGDRYLLCSDGLSREVTDDQIASILRRFGRPEEAAKELVAEARSNGGNDNITVVIVDVVDDDGRAATASAALAEDPVLVIPSEVGKDEAEASPASGGRTKRGRLSRRKARSAQPKTRAVTLRVIGFLLLLIVLLGGAAAAVGWYARGTYYVGVDQGRLTIFKGRPGGLLWFKPTIVERTSVTIDQVPASARDDVKSGKEESTLADARLYVRNQQAAQAATTATASPTTTTAPVTTTVPATTTSSVP